MTLLWASCIGWLEWRICGLLVDAWHGGSAVPHLWPGWAARGAGAAGPHPRAVLSVVDGLAVGVPRGVRVGRA